MYVLYRNFSFSLPKWSFLAKLEIAAFIAIALFNLIGALTPELFYDSQFYQTGLLTKWLQQNKIESSKYFIASFYPFNINMLYLLAMILNNEITAKLMHFLCGLTISFAVYLLGKRYFSRETGLTAALVFYSIPMVMSVSWKTAIELGIGVFEFATVFALLNYFGTTAAPIDQARGKDKNSAIPPAPVVLAGDRFWLFFAGVICGFSLGSKYTSILFCFIPSVAMIAAAGFLGKHPLKRVVADIALFSLAAAIIGSPWYIRNIIYSGNPVFPFFWQKIGFLSLKMTGSIFADPPVPPFTFMNYFLFLWPLTTGILQQESFPGPVFLLLVPLMLMFTKINKTIKMLLAYFLFALVFWMFFGRFYLRYFIPTLPVICVILSYYITHQSYSRTLRNSLVVLILFAAATNVKFAAAILNEMCAPIPYILGGESEKEYLSKY
jgi:4-amino-4-deoxy-L-arabinose transferase-like glycosyltransferase